MSYADQVFVENCRTILNQNLTDNSETVRPKWEDGTPAHTIHTLYVMNSYQLAKDSIPVMTLRKTGFKNCIDEILWIYQKKSNKISDLSSHIWDSWDIGDGTIGKAYGYQIAQRYAHHKYTLGEDLNSYPSAGVIDGWVWMDQMDGVIWDLKNNPASRSIMTNTFVHHDLHDMGLRPCAYSMTFNVTVDKDGTKVLNGMLNQRSQDMLTANNWNVVQYSVLLQMLAQVCGMMPGKFSHVVADMHIYDRHVDAVKKLIKTYDKHPLERNGNVETYGPYPNPTFWINPDVKNFYDFKVSDFALKDYSYFPFNYKIPVAV